MPILTISKKALDAGKAWTPGWHLVIFKKLEDGVVSSSGKSMNYKGYFEDAESGSETMVLYNDSEGLVSQLGELFAAAAGISLADIADRQIDFDKVAGNKLWVRVENELYKKNPTDAGRLVNKFVAYQAESDSPL